MWTPLFFLIFLHFLNATNEDIDPLTQIAQAFFKEDFFYTHLKSDFVNESISPCDNFYRRLCPKDFPEKSWIWEKLRTQVDAILKIKDFMSQEKHTIQRIIATLASDETNYNDERAIYSAINRLNSLDAFAGTIIPPRFYRFLPAALQRNRTAVLTPIVFAIKQFVATGSKEHVKDIKRFEDVILVDRASRMFVQRKGIEYEAARKRIESIIGNVIEEYLLRIRSASWSSKEDRFGHTRKHFLTAYVKDMSYAISFANRYSIPDKNKDNLIKLYETTFINQYQLLSDLSHMPVLRIFYAKLNAVYYIFDNFLYGAQKPQMAHANPREFTAFASQEQIVRNQRLVASIVMNQVFSIHASLSATISSLIASTGYVFAHEMYHQIQFAFGYIEDISEHLRAETCVVDHLAGVCNRFNEKACASAYTLREDAPDVYGIQIAFAVAQKMLGNNIDKIVFPDLKMTNRELFYNTIGSFLCTSDLSSQWDYKYEPNGVEQPDTHNGWMYRVNGLLGQLPDFKPTFGCYDDDRMKSMCPAFSEDLA